MATISGVGRASGVEPLDLAFDSPAVSELYERNAGRLFGYCLSRLGRREDAEDAVQTTFLHAIRSLRRGVVPLIESAWLLGIARNVCLTRREAFGRRRRLEAVCDPHDLESASIAAAPPPEELMGLDEALARLPERQRRAVLLRDWRGLSYDEVATELGVSRSAVETLIFRGRNALAEELGEEPRTTRKRLASLGNLGSLLAAVKGLFTGGTVAVKVAVGVMAISGAGLAVSVASPPANDAPPIVALRVVETKAAGAGAQQLAPAPAAAAAQAAQATGAVSVTPSLRQETTGPAPRRPSPTKKAAAAGAAQAPVATAAEAGGAAPTDAGPRLPLSPPAVAALPSPVAPPPAVQKAVGKVTQKVAAIVEPVTSVLPAVELPVPPVAELPLPVPVPPLPVPQLPVPQLPVPQLPVPQLPAPQLPQLPVPVPPVAAPALPVTPPVTPPALPPAPVTVPPLPPAPPLPPLLP